MASFIFIGSAIIFLLVTLKSALQNLLMRMAWPQPSEAGLYTGHNRARQTRTRPSRASCHYIALAHQILHACE